MRKFLISILIILLMILACFLILNDIPIGNWKNKNIDDIKQLNANLDEQIEIAKELKNQQYPTSIENLQTSIDALKTTKERYQSKVSYITDNVELGVVEIKEYKIERLWVTLGNYAKENGVDIQMDLLDTTTQDVYDLNITLIGGYIGITDFIYDIEKDDTLGFKILNFKILPNAMAEAIENSNTETGDTQTEDEPDIDKYTNENTTTLTSEDLNTLRATFKIEGLGIVFN